MKGQRRYKYLVIGRDTSYFANKPLRFYQKVLRNLYHQHARIVFIDNMFVMLGGRVFQQTAGMPMGINCAPLISDLFLYSYEADII